MGSEFDLIALLRERIEAAGAPAGRFVTVASGDDAAVTNPTGVTATSVDAAVDGVHFRRSTHSPEEIGAKALAAALSDLSAMGAEPGEAYVQLGVPQDIERDELLRIADGMGAMAARTGTALAGGDVVASPVLFLAISVVGHAAEPSALVTRSGARPGDAVVLTGPVGGAAAGLALLDEPNAVTNLAESLRESLIRRQKSPEPLLGAGIALARSGATAMIDVSDGLAADASHVASASGVRLELGLPDEMIQPGVAETAVALGSDPIDLAATGGEDYELLATIDPGEAPAALEALREAGSAPAVVGEVVAGAGVVVRDARGREAQAGGWDQMDSPARGASAS